LQDAANEMGKGEMEIREWTNSWLTKAGANSITADFSGVDE